jgi:hypothetical protein
LARNLISARDVRASGIVAGGGPASVRTNSSAGMVGDAAHDVSILMAAVGRYHGALARSKVSMMSMGPPQQGKGTRASMVRLLRFRLASLDLSSAAGHREAHGLA